MEQTSSIRFDDKIRAGLRAIAKEDQVSVSDVVREAMRRYLAVRQYETISARITKAAAKKGIITGEDAERAALAGIKRRRCRR